MTTHSVPPPSVRPGPDPFPWDELVAWVGRSQVVPVIGEAAMTILDNGKLRPISDILAERLAAECNVQIPNGASVAEVAAMAATVIRPPAALKRKLRRIHDDLLRDLKDENIGGTLQLLAMIDAWPTILTTSTSGLLERAVAYVRREQPKVVVLGRGEQLDVPEGFTSTQPASVVHLFGKISPLLNFPLSDEDILEALRDFQSERQPKRLLDELSNKPLLFIGTSLPDWLMRIFMRSLRRSRLSEDAMIRAVADETAAREPKLVLFLESLGQDTWVYSGDAPSFVQTLYDAWTRSQRQGAPPPQEHASPDPVVFLSYSTKDRAAAERAVSCLRERQLDVWFDRGELTSGNQYDPEIASAIKRCTFFIPLISRNTENASESYFRQEWALAIERLRKQTGSSRRFVVPLVIDDLKTSALTSVPSEFTKLTIQSAPGGQVPEDLLDRLVKELRGIRAAAGGV